MRSVNPERLSGGIALAGDGRQLSQQFSPRRFQRSADREGAALDRWRASRNRAKEAGLTKEKARSVVSRSGLIQHGD